MSKFEGSEDECCSCGTNVDVEFGPDPYAEDVYGDYTPVWECRICREISADDI